MKKNRTIKILWIVAALAAIGLAGCSILPGSEQADPTATPAPVIAEEGGVVAEGNLVPRDTVRLAFSVPGEVSEVLVAQGDQVAAGDVLARLAETEVLQASLAKATLDLLSAQQALSTLQDNALLATEQANFGVLEAALANLSAQQALADLDTDDYQQEIDDAIQAVIDADETLTDAQDAFDKVKDLDEDNNTRKNAEQDLEDAQREYDQAVLDRDVLTTRLDQARAAVVLTEAQLADAQTQADARADGPDPDELALAQESVKVAESAMAAAESAYQDLELKAPFAGTVVELDLAAGEEVTPAQMAMVVSDLSQWYVETNDLTENEVVKIAVGQRVTLTPDALPDLELSGKVESIGDMFVEKSGDITYVVRILLDESDPRLRWGMTFEVRFRE